MYVGCYKSGNYTYVRVMETVRDPDTGKVTTKIIKKVGRLDQLEKLDPQVLEKLRKQYGGTKQEREESKLSQQASALQSLLQAQQDLALPNLCPTMNYGYMVLKKLWDEVLGLDRRLNYLQRTDIEAKFDFNTAASFLVFSKVLDPHSVLRTFAEKDFLIGDPAEEITLDDCYSTLGLLRQFKDKIFRGINRRLDEVYGEERSLLLFYDVTNAYFESPLTDEERALEQVDYEEQIQAIAEEAKALGKVSDDCFDSDGLVIKEKLPTEITQAIDEQKIRYLKMRGPSKEHRFDLPIVSVALIIDRNGFPMDFEVYSGNSSEFKTMKESVLKFKKKYQPKQAIVVADRGLNSAANLAMLQKEGFGFLMAQKVSSFSGELLEKMLDLDAYTNIDDEDPEFGKYRLVKDFVKVDPKSKEPISCTLMFTFNECRKKRDERILDELVTKVENKAAAKARLGPSASGWAELAQTADPKNSKTSTIIGVNQKVEASRRKRCGFAALVFKNAPLKQGTNTQEEGISETEIASIYHSLNRIEECFRIMKTHLGLRPMFVWQSDHVRGHITVCVLALLLIKLLQRRLYDEYGRKFSIERLCQSLNEANVTLVKLSSDCNFFLSKFSKVDHVRRGNEKKTTEELLSLLDSQQRQTQEPLIYLCMKAVGLKPIKGLVDRTSLARCLKTHYARDSDAVSELVLKQCFPNLYTTS